MVIDYKKEGHIATFTINRPEAMNAMTPEGFVQQGLNRVP
jgi:enoyl-CoA hydratase/carnithine racemase